MGCREETKEINGHEYYCIQWPASKALKKKFRLIQLFGGAFSKLGSLIDTKGKISEEAISGFIGALFLENSPDDVFDFLKGVVISATRNGQRIDDATFEEFYSDNLMEFYQAVIFVLQVNYSNFFVGKLGSLMGKVGTPVMPKDS